MEIFILLNFMSKNSNTLEIKHSLLTACVAVFQYEWGSQIHFRSTALAYKTNSWDSRSICKHTVKFFISEIIKHSVVN